MYFYTVLYIFIWHSGVQVDSQLFMTRFYAYLDFLGFFGLTNGKPVRIYIFIYIYAILFGDGSGSELTFNTETPQNGIIYLFRI